MYSYVIEDETLITCDSFGAHYSDERVIKSQLEAEKEADYIEANSGRIAGWYLILNDNGTFQTLCIKGIR